MKEHLKLLSLKVRDRVTGATGVVTSISFELYGCVQALMTPEVDKDGKQAERNWFDTNRLEVMNENPVMPLPSFEAVPGGEFKPLRVEKPSPN